jgi:hypothetical protein
MKSEKCLEDRRSVEEATERRSHAATQDTIGVFSNAWKSVIGKTQLGKGDREGVGRSSPGAVAFYAYLSDFGWGRGSCEKMGLRCLSCGAGGIWVCTALDSNQLRRFGWCAFMRANGASFGQQGAHRHILNRQSAHSWDFPMAKPCARSAQWLIEDPRSKITDHGSPGGTLELGKGGVQTGGRGERRG